MNKKLLLLFLIVVIGTFLRFYHLSVNPPGLYWDEAVFGYDAYSILKTAHDHHGHFMPIFFESYGDWKLPVYHYLLVPSVAIFNLSPFAVRAPSAFFGTISIIVFYLLVKKLTKDQNLALIAALFLAISPWHIQFSRGGFEVNVGLFFTLLAAYFFVIYDQKKSSLQIFLSALFFAASMYTAHPYRIFTPLFILALIFIYKIDLKELIKKSAVPLIFIAVLTIPLLRFSLSTQGQARALSESVFKVEDLKKARLDFDQKSKKPFRFMSGYLYKKPIYFSYIALKNYTEHFSPVFLFLRGDQVGRHSQVDMGQIYIFDAIFIAVALCFLKWTKENKLMLAWLMLSPIPAIIVAPTPHAQRALAMVIPLTFLSAYGAYQIFKNPKFKLVQIGLIVFCLYEIASYLHLLFVHYPRKFAPDWQAGNEQMVRAVEKYQNDYQKIYITNINNVPYIYLLFYQSYEPKKFEETGTSQHFDKYYFVNRDTRDIYNNGRILYVSPPWETVDGRLIEDINDFFGRHVYSLWEVGQ